MSYQWRVDVFAGLADPVRRELLTRLLDGPLRVVDLARDRTISRPAVSRHLRVLLAAGLIAVEDRGRERHYRLHPAGLQDVRALVDRLDARTGATAPAVRFAPETFDGLELEVRRTRREPHRPASGSTPGHAETRRKDSA